MRYIPLMLLAISSLFLAQAVAQEPQFSSDELTIYRDFLLHYPMRLGDLIGMQPTTGDFSRLEGLIGMQPASQTKNSPYPALASFHLLIPAQSDRKFPADIMLLTNEEAVTRRIARTGQLAPISKRSSETRPDGYVTTHLQLSEIAFDQAHQLGVLIFSASCGSLGGEGGVAIYRHTRHGWRLEDVIDAWEG